MANIPISGLPVAVPAITGDELVPVIQSAILSKARMRYVRTPVNNRTQMTTEMVFHLATTGNFTTNTGLSTTSPWGPDLQHAMRLVTNNIDFRAVACTFSLANGSYTGSMQAEGSGTDNWGNFQAIGCKYVRITSDAASATAVSLDAQQLISYQQVPYIEFRDITIKGSVVCENGFCRIHNCNWTQFDDVGPTAGFCGPFSDFGQIVWSGVSTINGSAHFTVTSIGGIMQILATSIVASGGIIQPTALSNRGIIYCIDQGEVYISSSTVWGTASGGSWSGKRFGMLRGATINANGLGFAAIPGTVVGTIPTGCTYVG